MQRSISVPRRIHLDRRSIGPAMAAMAARTQVARQRAFLLTIETDRNGDTQAYLERVRTQAVRS